MAERGAAERFLEQIDLFVRARYPIVYVVTSEETRLETLLFDLSRRHGKPLFSWTSSRGLRHVGSAREASSVPTSEADLLERVRALPGAGLFLLADFPVHFDDPAVVRRTRDLAAELKGSHKTVFLSSPRLVLPPELEKEVTVVDLPLPDAEELRNLLRGLCQQLAEGDPELVQLTRSDVDALVRAAQGLTLSEAESAFSKAAVTDGKLQSKDVEIVLAEKRQVIRKSGILEFHPAETTLSDVGGLERLKDWLRRRGKALQPGAREFGLPPAKGVLLLGAPGCGKSLTAKVVAQSWRLPLLHLDLGRIFSGLLGSSEENMRKALTVAEGVAPAVLWIDEIEKGLSGNAGAGTQDGGTAQRVFGTLLTWMQEQRAGVFVVATANRIEALPPELLRKGRFDEIFFVDLPNAAAREEILRIHLAKRGRDPAKFAVAAHSKAADGFSGAELEAVVVEALFSAFDDGRELADADVSRAIAETTPLSVTSAEDIARMRSWAATRARPADAPGSAEPRHRG
ncbi:MAG TPA: AAA family ATPase [Myxococcota bacterium]|jgi:ATP-dependent 26S proteasome regulatory subunit|nr:AAA family ATPase [Myxococcota bacterium]